MKFTLSSVLTALLSASALAAPTTHVPRTGSQLAPTVVSHYNTWTGAIDYDKPTGLVKKGGGPEYTSLFTFNFDGVPDGRTCNFVFDVSGDQSATVDGSQMTLFTSRNPAPGPTSGWPPGNQRYVEMGRMGVSKTGENSWIYGSGSFPCPTSGQYGYELVGAGDRLNIAWTDANGGLRIRY
ncbi:hypothetical protein BDY21DRAFT_368574 [Lineolata rhizophorae]|uniref:Ubiquitin 3 binding protein But2 C-terminal domain-containing protein n=1 Tax=Lineolata rhizophorae TaxID=578093 RepID=A0A6A6PBM0_9PEZI|nr:hypothetical protein BDY21DRAFT_368574 [Lineolata rhizophorae]